MGQNTRRCGGQEKRDNFSKEIRPGGKSMGRWDKGRLLQMARVQREGPLRGMPVERERQEAQG